MTASVIVIYNVSGHKLSNCYQVEFIPVLVKWNDYLEEVLPMDGCSLNFGRSMRDISETGYLRYPNL